jgi:uncharacterized protein DUF6851/vanadium-dependent haloperoxidase-like protein
VGAEGATGGWGAAEPPLARLLDRPLSRRQLLRVAGAGLVVLAPSSARAAILPPTARPRGDSIVVRWNQAALQGVRDSRLGPPMVSRALAIVHTCTYDAWAAYDRDAVGTRLGGALRRPPAERTRANKEEAISFAAYRAAVDLFPASRATVFDPLMASLGYDPADLTTDPSRPAGVGNLAAAAVLAYRHGDGANQLGGYADTTGFASPNAPLDLTGAFDPATVLDPNAWQPLRYRDASGAVVTQEFVGAQWQQVTPFALASDGMLRSPTGPARFGSGQYVTQARQLLALSAALTDEQKMIAEYWADGPHSELPPGHWNLFAQFVARRDRHGDQEHGIDLDIKLFFALTNAVFDAGICAWDNKCQFASVRPITAIRYLFHGQPVNAWAGPYQSTRTIDGAAWLPYQPSTFPTPPFPEYSSGHSNFSAAGAEILRIFTGSDDFGASATLPAGSSRVEPGAVPARDLNLSWPTFSEAANQAGISRRYGGIHFQQGDLDARTTGREAARNAWTKTLSYINGTA